MERRLFRGAGARARLSAFAGAPLDRASEIARTRRRSRRCASAADARFVLIGRDMPILPRGELRATRCFRLRTLDDTRRRADRSAAGPGRATARRCSPRGCADDAVEQRADLSDGFLDRRELVIPGRDDLELVDLRSIAMQGLVAPMSLAMLGQAKAILDWHARHGFCANCGAPTRLAAAGWRRECDACKAHHFPAHRSGRHHAGARRRALPDGPAARAFPRACIRRSPASSSRARPSRRRCGAKSARKAGIECGACAMSRRSPGRFPSSLMIGCLARARRGHHDRRAELEDARWFDARRGRGDVRETPSRRPRLPTGWPSPITF